MAVAVVGELQVIEPAIRDERHAGREFRRIVMVEIPEIIGRLASGGETQLGALFAHAEIHIEQGLSGGREGEE